jgi:pantothenate kinase type III
VLYPRTSVYSLTHSLFSSLRTYLLYLHTHNTHRTPPLDKEEQQDDPCAVLARHLPHQAHALIFGDKDAPASKVVAAQVSAKRKIPAISIYIVTTNQEHESALQFLFKDVTTRMVKLRNTDFSTKEQGLYETMGVDRVAALVAARELYSAPVMVLDHGTAMTYTVMDRDEKIVGGGISPGIAARFRAMSDYCGSLPRIDPEKFNNVLKEAASTGTPLPTFATDTETAMITSVISEVCNHARCVVKQFLEKVGVEDPETTDGAAEKPAEEIAEKENNNPEGEEELEKKDTRPTVVVTGGDSNILAKMLEKGYASVNTEPGTVLPVEDYQLYNMKHLIHYGVGHLLNKKAVKRSEHPDDVLRDRIIGLRVAKEFDEITDDEDKVYRGSIIRIAREDSLEQDLFYVRYDDGDAEHCEVKEIYGKEMDASLSHCSLPPTPSLIDFLVFRYVNSLRTKRREIEN